MVVENFIDPGWGLEVELPDGTILRVDDDDDDVEVDDTALSIINAETFHLAGQHSQKSHAGKSVSIGGDAANVREQAEELLNGQRDARDALAGGDSERQARNSMLEAHSDYIGSGYRDINAALRGTELPNQELLDPPYQARARDNALRKAGHLDRAFDEMGVQNSDPITVHRSIRPSPELRTQLETRGSVITDDGFMSTSTDAEVADGFRSTGEDLRLSIRVPPGRTSIAGSGSESELIYPRGSSLEVLGYDRDQGVVTARMV